MLATANTGGKNRKRFWKNAGEWTGRVEISKEEILCMSVLWDEFAHSLT